MEAARIWIHAPGSAGPKSTPLQAETTLVGRGDHCEIRILEETVSSDHLEIVQRGTSFIARDLGSRNGTLLNGNRLTQDAKLTHGDVLFIGTHRLEVDLPRRRATIAAEGLEFDLTADELAVAKALVAPLRQTNSFVGRPATRAEIAERVNISESSVKRRLDSMALKLGVPADAKRERPRLVADRIIALGIDQSG